MSELMNTQQASDAIRWQLLTTASSLALLASVCGTQRCHRRGCRPPNGMDRTWCRSGSCGWRAASFAPPFVVNNPGHSFRSGLPGGSPEAAGFSFGGEGKLSFQPEDSNWVFSASVRYGRANSKPACSSNGKNKPLFEHVVYQYLIW